MSIRILPDTEIKQAASSFEHPPLLFANPKNLYARRAKRLRQLAADNPFKDYLEFAANLVEVQLDLLENHPIANEQEKLTACITQTQGNKPLNAKNFHVQTNGRNFYSHSLRSLDLTLMKPLYQHWNG